MGDVVNLNKFRKARQSREEKRAAAANRGKYGRSKAELLEMKAERDRTGRDLEGKRLEGGSPAATSGAEDGDKTPD
ncbi:MAG TPA: DUF4169 family protein [Hypericibacter adhaerens]|jgi:hypothetical protein|uniref:DUF4169 domain-containing protein n=1 Tax=Hypericibacter adhaerens TaxID=2602016 RepID=A0A5J6MVP2_9PROT|nr:DUF4169 family protein [Hypericibacter adhaerens]QEX21274.1 hypothetical protein FRZ61_11980 [Hypericibacter adhaerens]HWA44428.1 DUF4169 family protein [Hypericibacter adhaerens]